MASPPAAGVFDFHIRRGAGRAVHRLPCSAAYRWGTSWRWNCPTASSASGPNRGGGVLMVAGGTGLAPIKCILEAQAAADALPETLLYWGAFRSTRDL